jgi:transcription-repair coupling factor (superfamily II helicase)
MTELTLDLELPTKEGEKKWWGNVQGAGRGLAIAQAASQHKGITIVVVPSNNEAELISEQIAFFTKGTELPLLHLPDWETLPYDTFSPHQDIISQRLEALFQLPTLKAGILVVAVSTLMQRLAPASYINQNSLIFDKNSELNPAEFLKQLDRSGYNRVETVYEHGDFAVRGSLIDLYPMGSKLPYRIELFDDEIESIRTFSPETQRTYEKVDQVRILPAKEFPLDQAGIRTFKDNWNTSFDVNNRNCPIYEAVASGMPSPGLEYYLDLFFDQTATLFDYLPQNTLTFLPNDIEVSAQRFWHDINSRFDQYGIDPHRPLLPPSKVFMAVDELFTGLKTTKQIILRSEPLDNIDKAGRRNLAFGSPPILSIDSRSETPLLLLQKHLQEHQGKVLFCAESAGRREALLELLKGINIKPAEFESWHAFNNANSTIAITIAPIDSGLHFEDPQDSLSLIAESQIFGERIQQKRRRSKASENLDNVVKDLTELKTGAPVVHIDHGIGRYLGLETIEIDGQAAEFLTLVYANEAKL